MHLTLKISCCHNESVFLCHLFLAMPISCCHLGANVTYVNKYKRRIIHVFCFYLFAKIRKLTLKKKETTPCKHSLFNLMNLRVKYFCYRFSIIPFVFFQVFPKIFCIFINKTLCWTILFVYHVIIINKCIAKWYEISIVVTMRPTCIAQLEFFRYIRHVTFKN